MTTGQARDPSKGDDRPRQMSVPREAASGASNKPMVPTAPTSPVTNPSRSPRRHIGRPISRNTSPGTADLTAHNFSTTGPVEATVGHVALMGAMQNYFRYGMRTSCGIPKITLLGTPEDWESIKRRVEWDFTREAMDFGWWLDSLIPILDQFIRASKGDVDAPFWESIYKEKSMSGGSTVSGSFVNLFPYLTTLGKNYRNPWLGKEEIRMSADEYPKGYTTVPFEWDCMGTNYPMNFVAGHLGVGVVDGSIRPVLGWAVADQPSEKKSGRR